jgi:hypothetical protein
MALTPDQKLSIRQLAEQVLRTTRPSELILVKHLDLDRQDGVETKDGILGFDSGAVAHVVLPHLVLLLQTIATSGLTEIAETWGKALASWLIASDDSPKLDSASLRSVGESFRNRLIREGWSEQDGLKISDTLVATLVAHPALLRKIAGAKR